VRSDIEIHKNKHEGRAPFVFTTQLRSIE